MASGPVPAEYILERVQIRFRLFCCLPFLPVSSRFLRPLPEGQRYPLPGNVHFQHRCHNLLVDLHRLVRVLDIFAGKPADVREAVLVHADVDEGAEGGHVGDDALEHHSRCEVVELLRRVPLAVNGNYVLCDGGGQILDVEATSAGPELLHDDGAGFIAHSNHYVAPALATPENHRRCVAEYSVDRVAAHIVRRYEEETGPGGWPVSGGGERRHRPADREVARDGAKLLEPSA